MCNTQYKVTPTCERKAFLGGRAPGMVILRPSRIPFVSLCACKGHYHTLHYAMLAIHVKSLCL